MPISASLPSPEARWYYSVIEVAAYLGVAPDTVYRWMDKKKLPAHSIGRPRKCKLAEVDRWVRAGGSRVHRKFDAGRTKRGTPALRTDQPIPDANPRFLIGLDCFRKIKFAPPASRSLPSGKQRLTDA